MVDTKKANKPEIWLIQDPHSAQVVSSGDGATRAAEVREAAYDFLIASEDWSVDRADMATENANVARAYWGGEEFGFVQQDHPEARPVSVVNLNATESR